MIILMIIIIMILPHGVELGLPSGLSHSWTPHTHLHMRWMHGSAAASAKRTEIRRAVRSLGGAARSVSDQGRGSRKLKQLPDLKTIRYNTMHI